MFPSYKNNLRIYYEPQFQDMSRMDFQAVVRIPIASAHSNCWRSAIAMGWTEKKWTSFWKSYEAAVDISITSVSSIDTGEIFRFLFDVWDIAQKTAWTWSPQPVFALQPCQVYLGTFCTERRSTWDGLLRVVWSWNESQKYQVPIPSKLDSVPSIYCIYVTYGAPIRRISDHKLDAELDDMFETNGILMNCHLWGLYLKAPRWHGSPLRWLGGPAARSQYQNRKPSQSHIANKTHEFLSVVVAWKCGGVLILWPLFTI